MAPVVSVDHAPTTAFAREAYTLPPGPPISVPAVSELELISVSKQLDSASGRGLETPSTVGDHVVHTIVIANYWSFSTCLWPPVACCPMPQCKYPQNLNKISL